MAPSERRCDVLVPLCSAAKVMEFAQGNAIPPRPANPRRADDFQVLHDSKPDMFHHVPSYSTVPHLTTFYQLIVIEI